MNLTLLLQFLTLIDEIRKPNELLAEFERFLDRYAFDFYGVLSHPRMCGEPMRPLLGGRWPPGWPELYVQRKYVLIDPTIRYLGQAQKGYRWQEAVNAFQADPHRRRMERMMAEARTYGLKDGYIFPVHGRRGLLGVLSMGGRPVNLTAVEATIFDSVAKKLFWKLVTLGETETADTLASGVDFQMTHREMEVLQYLAEGMTSNEISRILGLSPHTIDWYMNSLQDKLRAKNRHHTIAVAFRLGLVS